MPKINTEVDQQVRLGFNLQGGERDENQSFDGAFGGPIPPDDGGRRRRRYVPGGIRGAVDEPRRGIGVDRRDLRQPLPAPDHLPRAPLHDGRRVLPEGRSPPIKPPDGLGLVTGPGRDPRGRDGPHIPRFVRV